MDSKCGSSTEKAKCPEKCRAELKCGHVCPLRCHRKKEHSSIKCIQSCNRTCPEGHSCPRKCHEICGDCSTKIEKLLPCGHAVYISVISGLNCYDMFFYYFRKKSSAAWTHKMCIATSKSKKPCPTASTLLKLNAVNPQRNLSVENRARNCCAVTGIRVPRFALNPADLV